MEEDIILSVENLSVDFYTFEGILHVLDGVSFKVRRGEIFGLVGETGCGKSVTSKLILGMIANNARIKSGKIIFNNKDILKMSEKELNEIRGRDISMIFQNPLGSLNPLFKIKDQMINVIVTNLKVDKETALERAFKYLKLVEMPDPERVLNSYPFELSGGMAQRVMIAMALSVEPKLLIADEPTTALDVTIQAQILQLLKKLQEKLGVSILFITHDLSVVAQICDRVGVMYAGNVVAYGDVYDIMKHPKHPYTIGLMRAIPNPENKGKPIPRIKGSVPNYLNPPKGCRFHPRCEYAMEICKKEKPKLFAVGKNHYVACWLYGGDHK